jgi:hypothetical protein
MQKEVILQVQLLAQQEMDGLSCLMEEWENKSWVSVALSLLFRTKKLFSSFRKPTTLKSYVTGIWKQQGEEAPASLCGLQ